MTLQRASVVLGFVFISLGSPAVARSAELVGQWRLDEGQGQVVSDTTAVALDGTLGPTSVVDPEEPEWIPGLFGGALRFEGGSRVVVPNAKTFAAPTVSVALWLRRSGSPNPLRHILWREGDGCLSGAYSLATVGGGRLAFRIHIAGEKSVSSPSAPLDLWDGRWHHAVGTFDGNTVRLYIDGSEVGNGTATTRPIWYPPLPSGVLAPGGCSLGMPHGDLDEIEVYDGALTAGEVANLAARRPSILPPGQDVPAPTRTFVPLPSIQTCATVATMSRLVIGRATRVRITSSSPRAQWVRLTGGGLSRGVWVRPRAATTLRVTARRAGPLHIRVSLPPTTRILVSLTRIAGRRSTTVSVTARRLAQQYSPVRVKILAPGVARIIRVHSGQASRINLVAGRSGRVRALIQPLCPAIRVATAVRPRT